jgi:imidazolonepropionase-like amidohydrolase
MIRRSRQTERLMSILRYPIRLAALFIALASPLANAAEAPAPWVLKGAKVYPAPDAKPIENGVVVIRGGKIAAVGGSEVPIPERARVSECSGGMVTAGFQNSHVHFISEEFRDARNKAAPALTAALSSMLTRFGYTTVVETATFDLANSVALRSRIESGQVPGPRILTVGLGLFPPQGIPIYLSHLPKELRDRQPQPASAAAAVQAVRENFAGGADATKLFIATPIGEREPKRMSAAIIQAAVNEAHARKALVMVHPTDVEGVKAAIAAKVDVIVHSTLGGGSAPWPDDVVRQFKEAGMVMVPTLKLLGYELKKEKLPDEQAKRIVADTVTQFRAFVAAGGRVAFGTDVGYMTDYDATEEYVLMSQAGMSPMQILASLTTEPAKLWREGDRRGRLVSGMDADIVVLDADPADEARNFAKVRCAFRQGKPIYEATRPAR